MSPYDRFLLFVLGVSLLLLSAATIRGESMSKVALRIFSPFFLLFLLAVTYLFVIVRLYTWAVCSLGVC